MKSDDVDGVEFGLGKLGTLLKAPEKRRAVLSKKWRRHFDGLRLCVRQRAQIEQVARLGLVPKVQHFLGDDFRAGFEFDFPPGMLDDIKWFVGQRGADHDVNFASSQKKFEELGVLFIVSADLFSDIAQPWIDVA